MPFFYRGRFFRTLGQFFLPPSQNNYVNKILFPEAWKNFVTIGKIFVFEDWKSLIFPHYLEKIVGLGPAIFSGTPRNSENQILSIINSKKWPESPQKHQKIQKSIMLK